MKIKIIVNAALGITTEILYILAMMLAALLICSAFYFMK
jgi:type IV secretory pathway VirB3-like protein